MEVKKLGRGHVGNKNARGYLNNNPLNLRHSVLNRWRGLVGVDGKNFCQFDSVENGLRAAMINLRTYINKRNINTVSSIVGSWAPVSDGNYNNANYIRYVSSFVGVAPTAALSFDYSTISKLVSSMAVFESNYTPSSLELLSAWNSI